ncbi:MAG: hypothetical protein ISEC1_P0080 [Thiomicrorhabdus sp.]|nr:MAG: hypothetical protein ISEC1_P0080 [Thiomicrorhabdus sp.]
MHKIPLLLIGGGGHCRSCIDVVDATGEYEIVGIVEADGVVPDNMTPYDLVGFDSDLPSLLQETPHCLISVGQVKSSQVRENLFMELKVMGAILPSIISPSAYVSPTAKVGEGSIVMHQAMVNAYAQIGCNVIVNSQALVEHDAVIANHCHISTGSKVNGEVLIGEGCLIGSGSVIKQGVELTDHVVIGAGSLVLENIHQAGTCVGLVK